MGTLSAGVAVQQVEKTHTSKSHNNSVMVTVDFSLSTGCDQLTCVTLRFTAFYRFIQPHVV